MTSWSGTTTCGWWTTASSTAVTRSSPSTTSPGSCWRSPRPDESAPSSAGRALPGVGHQFLEPLDVDLGQAQHHERPAVVRRGGEEQLRLTEQSACFSPSSPTKRTAMSVRMTRACPGCARGRTRRIPCRRPGSRSPRWRSRRRRAAPEPAGVRRRRTPT